MSLGNIVGISKGDGLVQVSLSLQEIINLRLIRLRAGSTYILNDAAFEVIQVLILDKVPDLNLTLLVMTRAVLVGHWASV